MIRIRQNHPLLLRLLRLAFLLFGVFVLGFPIVGELPVGAFWPTLAITLVGLLFLVRTR